MSVSLFRAAAEVTMLYKTVRMTSGQKHLLRELCDYADDDKGIAWCHQESLMRRMCISSQQTLITGIKALEAAKWLTKRRGAQCEYAMNIQAIMANEPPLDSPPPKIGSDNLQKLEVTPPKIGSDNLQKLEVTPPKIGSALIRRTDNEQTEEQTLNRASAKQPMIPLPQRLCLQLSVALKINAQPTTAVSSTHPGMLALVKAIPAEWEDTALAMAPEVVKELVGNGKAGPGLYAYTLAVLKTRMERAVSQSALAGAGAGGGECPHDQIVALWGEVLPGCRQPIKWSGQRARNLADRWGEDESRQSLDWWRKFFRYLGESDYLMGKTRHRFSLGLDWIIQDENFLKALEGGYENGDDNA